MSIIARKVLFVPTGTYDQQYFRPFESTLNMENLQQFQRKTRMGTNLEANNLAGIAGTILSPTAQPCGNVTIINGWNERRYRFMIELDVINGGLTRKQILTGYTDYLGTGVQSTISPTIDQNMQLYINSVMTLRQTLVQTERGQIQGWCVLDNAHLVRDTDNGKTRQFGPYVLPDSKSLLRPHDVFCRMGSFALEAQGDSLIHDYRTSMVGGLEKSQRRNTGSASYLSRVLKAHQSAMRENELTGDISSIADVAGGNVHDGDLYDDHALFMMANNSNLMGTGAVSYGQMCSIIQGFDNSAYFINLREVQQQGLRPHQAGETEHWGGANAETLAATILNNSVSTIMADTLLTEVNFHAHNSTLNGEIFVGFSNERPFRSFTDAIDVTPYAEIFRNRMCNEVLMDITHRNQIPFLLTMRVDLLGETFIDISLNNAPSIPYTVPSFCDALMAPVITGDPNTLSTLASDIENLSSNLNVNLVNAL